jgi:hypothetical protein
MGAAVHFLGEASSRQAGERIPVVVDLCPASPVCPYLTEGMKVDVVDDHVRLDGKTMRALVPAFFMA